MPDIVVYILFPVGFFLLIKGADILVEGASSIASRVKISPMVIGLTIVAFGSSAPEFVVNVLASFNGNAGLALGNILGSNIANIMLILGVSSIIAPLVVQKHTVSREIPFSMLAAIALAFMANDVWLDGAIESVLSRSEGLVMLAFFSIFLYYVYTLSQKGYIQEEEIELLSVSKSTIFTVLGLAGLMVGGHFIVEGAVLIAKNIGLSESVIGLTVVAIGTSLPELATSAVAAYKNQADIAIGNVIGSNIFNIFWVLGLSSTINPLPINQDSNYDILVVLGVTLMLFAFLFVSKQKMLHRWQGIVFVTGYVGYLTWLVVLEVLR